MTPRSTDHPRQLRHRAAVAVLAVILLLAGVAGAGPASAAAANDDFEDAQPLQTSFENCSYRARWDVAQDLAEATAQIGEPPHDGQSAEHSIWFSVTAPHSGVMYAYTSDPLRLAVYRGATLTSLQPLVDDDPYRSSIEVQVLAGDELKIAVDTTSSPSSVFGYLSIWLPHDPPNDDFADAQHISGSRGRTSYCGGTRELGEPAGTDSVWYRWVAPADGFESFGVNAGDTVQVYRGSTLAELHLVATAYGGDPNFSPGFRVYADLWTPPGQTYYVRVINIGDGGTLTWRRGTDYPDPAADFDRDGCEDLVVGAPGEDLGGASDAGAVVVRYGCGGPTQRWHQGNDGVDTAGEAYDRFGHAVAAGDFDRNGYADLAIGIPGEDRGSRRNAGGVVILSGSPDGLTNNGSRKIGQNATSGPLSAAEAGDHFGTALASYQVDVEVGCCWGGPPAAVPPLTHPAHLFIGVPGEDHSGKTNAGTIAEYRGEPRIISALTSRFNDNDRPVRAQNGGALGASVSAGGRYYHAQSSRMWVAGHPGLDVSGKRDAGGMVHVGSENLVVDRDILATPQAGDRLGAAVTVADLHDGTTAGVLVAGAPGRDVGGARNAGMVVLYSYGRTPVTYHQATKNVPDRPEAGDRFGASLASGFFNTDTKEDIVVGVPGEDFDGLTNPGMITVLSGSSAQALHMNSPGMAGTARGGDAFGSSVGGPDINGDTVDEIVAGAPGDDVNGMADAGSVVVRWRSGSSTRYDAAITPHGAEAGDRFGAAVLQ